MSSTVTDIYLPPRFSVVIPLYNKERYIDRAIRSVLAQSFVDFEIVVVDDGSTDNSANILMKHTDPRIKCIHQKNAGVSAARNIGVRQSSAEFIAFLDADDEWYPWHLEELDGLIIDYSDAGIYSVAHKISQDGKYFLPARCVDDKFRGYVENFFKAFGNGLSLVNSSTACVNRSAFLDCGGFPVGIRRGEDVYVWLKIAHATRLVHSGKVCAVYDRDTVKNLSEIYDPEIPYYFNYLDELVCGNSLSDKDRSDANKLLIKSVIVQAAGFRLVGNNYAICELKKLLIIKRSMFLSAVLSFILRAPKKLFLYLRIIRRHA